MNCQIILTNKVCAAVLLLWVMEAMFNRILFCCNGFHGTVLRFVEIVAITNTEKAKVWKEITDSVNARAGGQSKSVE
jgi:hypothetical protein